MFLTCFDQVGDVVRIDNNAEGISPSEFLHKFVDAVNTANNDITPNVYVCCGEYQSNVIKLDTEYSSINKERNTEHFHSLLYCVTHRLNQATDTSIFDVDSTYTPTRKLVYYESNSRYNNVN